MNTIIVKSVRTLAEDVLRNAGRWLPEITDPDLD
jgi:hypothetical protein